MVINSDDIDRDGGGHGGGDQWLILRWCFTVVLVVRVV
jgi:hypothetical protein